MVPEKEASTKEMSDAIGLTEGPRDIPGRCLPVGMHTFSANHSVERFKRLRGEKTRRPKASHMLNKMENYMELWLVKPAYRPSGRAQQKVADLVLKSILCVCDGHGQNHCFQRHGRGVETHQMSLHI